MEFDLYRVEVTLLEKLLGTVPKNPQIYSRYIASKSPVPDDDEVETVPGDLEQAGWTGFHTDQGGIFLYDYQVLGFLKEAAVRLKDQLGLRTARSLVERSVVVEPRRIFLSEGPDGCLERPLRAQTRQGPRVTLIRSDYVLEGRGFRFQVRVLGKSAVTENVLTALFDSGRYWGFGQFRSGGFGRFSYVIEKIP